MARRAYSYILGDSRRESARLRAQGRLWDPVTQALFDRLRIKPGWRILEVGPGQGSLHLELRRRAAGPVDAVERSPVFTERLRRLCAKDGLGEGRLWQSDLLDARLPRDHYDLIFVRWVFLFLPDPAAHLRKLVRALRKGGRLAIQDYHRETFAMIPRPPEWSDFLAADRAFFASQGGNASIAGLLPELYRQSGLDVVEIVPTIKWGHPGSAVWRWLSDYFLGVMDRYVELGAGFSAAQARSLGRRWLAAGRERTSMMIGPAVIDVVGQKR